LATLKARLEAHVQAMVNAGNLRIGYFDGGQHWNRSGWGDRYEDYFSNPGETCWALIARSAVSVDRLADAGSHVRSELADERSRCRHTRISAGAAGQREKSLISRRIGRL
jgi:hypothetical protein